MATADLDDLFLKIFAPDGGLEILLEQTTASDGGLETFSKLAGSCMFSSSCNSQIVGIHRPWGMW